MLFTSSEFDTGTSSVPVTPKRQKQQQHSNGGTCLNEFNFSCTQDFNELIAPALERNNKLQTFTPRHNGTSPASQFTPGSTQYNLQNHFNAAEEELGVDMIRYDEGCIQKQKHLQQQQQSKKSRLKKRVEDESTVVKRGRSGANGQQRPNLLSSMNMCSRAEKLRANNTWIGNKELSKYPILFSYAFIMYKLLTDVLSNCQLVVASRDNGDIIIEYMNQGFAKNFYTGDVWNDDDQKFVETDGCTNDDFPVIKKTELLRCFFGIYNVFFL